MFFTEIRGLKKFQGLVALLLMLPLMLLSLGTASPTHASARNGCDETTISLPAALGTTSTIMVQGDEDTILVRRNTGEVPSTQIKVVLRSTSSITKWKGIQVLDGGDVLAEPFTKDSKHLDTATFFFDQSVAADYGLRFMKAKFLGIHRGMYCLDNLSGLGGSTLTFDWTND